MVPFYCARIVVCFLIKLYSILISLPLFVHGTVCVIVMKMVLLESHFYCANMVVCLLSKLYFLIIFCFFLCYCGCNNDEHGCAGKPLG